MAVLGAEVAKDFVLRLKRSSYRHASSEYSYCVSSWLSADIFYLLTFIIRYVRPVPFTFTWPRK